MPTRPHPRFGSVYTKSASMNYHLSNTEMLEFAQALFIAEVSREEANGRSYEDMRDDPNMLVSAFAESLAKDLEQNTYSRKQLIDYAKMKQQALLDQEHLSISDEQLKYLINAMDVYATGRAAAQSHLRN